MIAVAILDLIHPFGQSLAPLLPFDEWQSELAAMRAGG